MISKKMSKALMKQVNAELYSAYLYMAMSSSANSKGFNGMAGWLMAQALEEAGHAQKFYGYLQSQGEHVVLEAIAKPPADYTTPKKIFQEVLAHEKKVTALINGLVNLAITEKDHATNNFLQWFVAEQVEEEESATEILSRFALAGNHVGALFMLDRELGGRRPGGSGQ